MKRLCIIPARGGSKRLPDKNTRSLNGIPLIAHTINAVEGCFDKVVISSDSPAILASAGVPVNEIDDSLRPSKLATDDSKVIDTIRYIYDAIGHDYDQIWYCLPTCPLRTKEDVKGAMGCLTKKVDSVVSITDYDFPPMLGLYKTELGLIYDWLDTKPYQKDNTRSQDQMRIYRPNGAIYGAWCKSFEKTRNFFTGKVEGYFMPRERSVDIDTELDFKIAEVLLNEKP